MNKGIELQGDELRNLQLNELELLVEVDRICRKNGIEYSLAGGTLIGALRHKGFIPWDDDADIYLTRTEYEKFYKVCEKELNSNEFFLQEYRTDPNYRWGYAKMRNLKTEYIRCGQEHMKYVTGVCIDIFIIDNVPDNKVFRYLYYWIHVFLRKVLYSEVGMVNEKNIVMRVFFSILYLIPRDHVFKICNILAKSVNSKKTELITHTLLPYPAKIKYGILSECMDGYEDIEFEGMNFRTMKGYDIYLTAHYGDYMTPPPKEKQHGLDYASKVSLYPITLEEIKKKYSYNCNLLKCR